MKYFWQFEYNIENNRYNKYESKTTDFAHFLASQIASVFISFHCNILCFSSYKYNAVFALENWKALK